MARQPIRRGLLFKPKPKLAEADFEAPEPKPSRRPWLAIAVLWVVTVAAAVVLRGGALPLELWIDAVVPAERRPPSPAAPRQAEAAFASERPSASERTVAPGVAPAPSPELATLPAVPEPAPEQHVQVRPEGRPRELPRGVVAAGYVTPGRPYGGERPEVEAMDVDRAQSGLDDAVLEEDDVAR